MTVRKGKGVNRADRATPVGKVPEPSTGWGMTHCWLMDVTRGSAAVGLPNFYGGTRDWDGCLELSDARLFRS